MTPSIAPVLEAIALAATVRLRWPECDPANGTKVMTTKFSYFTASTCDAAWAKFTLPGTPAVEAHSHEDYIRLDPLWTGSQRIWLGYGLETDTLAVRLPEEIREQSAGGVSG